MLALSMSFDIGFEMALIGRVSCMSGGNVLVQPVDHRIWFSHFVDSGGGHMNQ